MKQVKKAVIPVAGFGTRFLPFTKALPKEMLPIIDKPTIQYMVEEAVASGIKEILFITSAHSNKRSIEDHFDRSQLLENLLEEKQKDAELKIIKEISQLAKIHYVRQPSAKGIGDAILCAKHFVGNEPFAILTGDDLMLSERPTIGQVIEAYNKVQKTVLGVQPVPWENVYKYGIIYPEDKEILSKVVDYVEKPPIEEAKSNLAGLGRYVMTPEIFTYLETQEVGLANEIHLTDAVKRMMSDDVVYCLQLDAKYYDIGNKLEYLKATIDIALSREDVGNDFREFLEMRVKNEN